MKAALTRSEVRLASGIGLLCLIALLAPGLPQDPHYHLFADARTLWGIPRAMDVLSNIGFAAFGIWGLGLMGLGKLEFFSAGMRRSATAFFLGFVATGVGSAWYHLAPDDAGLGWDRLGMTIAFAGILGLAATQRVSERAGDWLLGFALVSGPLAVGWWLMHGSVTPYAVLQFGGMLTAALCLLGRSRGPGPNWGWLLVAYTAAKLAEACDAQVFGLTQELLSGHTLKHVLAALPALAVALPLMRGGQAKRAWGGRRRSCEA